MPLGRGTPRGKEAAAYLSPVIAEHTEDEVLICCAVPAERALSCKHSRWFHTLALVSGKLTFAACAKLTTIPQNRPFAGETPDRPPKVSSAGQSDQFEGIQCPAFDIKLKGDMRQKLPFFPQPTGPNVSK